MAMRSHNAPNARDGNKTVAQLVDESIDLWSKMVKDEEEKKAITTTNVLKMQARLLHTVLAISC